MFQDHQINSQLILRGIESDDVLAAIKKVRRDEFVPDEYKSQAFDDCPLPIGYNQTISQPYIVAFMTEALEIDKNSRVLEIGTGSGYQTAILAEIAKEVCTIEIVEPLGVAAKKTLEKEGYRNINFKISDGTDGWGICNYFDAIIITAAPATLPKYLLEELKVGGRMIVPVGEFAQDLREIKKTPNGVEERSFFSVRFVPMTGKISK